jgi:SanA protein
MHFAVVKYMVFLMHNNEMLRALKLFVILVLILLAALMCIPLFMRHDAAPYTFHRLLDVPRTDVAIVLGASVRGGQPSPILEQRANAAVQLYLAGKVQKILVTGDNSALSHDEVTPVRKYLLAAGIPAAAIFLDHAGFDTYSSMYRARAIFGASSVTIVTQDFHLPRAIFIAHALGLNAYGFNAEGEGTEADYVREIPASLKALWDISLRRVPKYLGDPIPLTGDGTVSWY